MTEYFFRCLDQTMRMELRLKYPYLIFKQLKDSLKFTTLISFQDILYGIFQKYYLLFGFVLLLCEEISFLQPLYLLLITCFFLIFYYSPMLALWY